MKSHYAEYILFFTFLAPHVWTEYSYICGKKSSNLQCHQNETVEIHDVHFPLWRYRCNSAADINCNIEIESIKKRCNTKTNCTLKESDFKSCRKQPRRVFVTFSCIPKLWYGRTYIKRSEVCGSLSAIYCDLSYYKISEIRNQWDRLGDTCAIEGDVINCLRKSFNLCIGHRSCDHVNVNEEMCFYLPFKADTTYSCNKEGADSAIPTEKNTRNHSYIPTTDVSPMTYVFDITKTGEIEWVFDVDTDFRLLIINKKENQTYSLCANKWKNEYAKFVCRHLDISDNGIAGNIPRNINLTRIAYGVDCPDNITNTFECSPDYSNNSREICDSIGDATIKCYNNTENYVSDKTDLCINIIAVGATSFATIIIFLLVIIYIQRRKLVKASYTTLTVRRDENNYNGIAHQMSGSTTEHYYEESPLSVIPTSEGQAAAHQNMLDQIQHVDTSGYLILSNTMETRGDHYHSIAN